MADGFPLRGTNTCHEKFRIAQRYKECIDFFLSSQTGMERPWWTEFRIYAAGRPHQGRQGLFRGHGQGTSVQCRPLELHQVRQALGVQQVDGLRGALPAQCVMAAPAALLSRGTGAGHGRLGSGQGLHGPDAELCSEEQSHTGLLGGTQGQQGAFP